jgi:AcrR family transcriptional regulator
MKMGTAETHNRTGLIKRLIDSPTLPAMVPPPIRTAAASPTGSEPDPARDRLLRAGLQLFSQQGFAGTTTRELAQLAGVNVAAISYYFGDKAGLYRAVFFEPLGGFTDGVAALSAQPQSLEATLRAYYAQFVAPLAEGPEGACGLQCAKLRMREMVEPTGLWDQAINEGIRPLHLALVAALCRHLGLAEADDEVRRLAICLSALGVHLHLGPDVIDVIAPQLNQGPDAASRWADCLLRQGLAMVEQERLRRASTAPMAPSG